jgi:hypothetical protein
MSLRLDGTNVLSHIGVTPESVASDYIFKRDPTSKDYQNFNLMDRWLNYVNQVVWVLVSKVNNIATWQRVSGSVRTLTSNSGGAVGPDNVGNINVVGDGTTITGVGNPGTNTITLSVIGGMAASSFPTDSGTATPSAGVLNVFGGTLARNINTSGSGHTIHTDLNNAITLGDLSVITTGNNAIAITSGNITLSGTGASAAGNINLPNTSTDGRQGEITFGSSRFISNFGTANTFVGAGSGNTTLSGSTNTIVGFGAGAALTTSAGSTGVGNLALSANTTGNNDAFGTGALQNCTTGGSNVSIGALSMQSGTTPSFNVAVGLGALQTITTGLNNTAVGYIAASNLTTGGFNIALGQDAGIGWATSDSSNIAIGNGGAGGQSNQIHIGISGAGSGQQNKCFIAGIRGITTTNNDAIAVLIDSAGQLGTVSSSLRYKYEVEDMDDFSKPIMKLRPVIFRWKETDEPDWGLIAEEVHEVMPELVIYDDEGEPETVKYHVLCSLMLNELQKLSKKVRSLEKQIKAQ